jgi:hypothetical protein
METPPFPLRRRWLPVCVTALALLLGSCGGGLYVGWDSGYGDDPPHVSLSTSASAVGVGSAVRLNAYAEDDHGVSRVDFYRIDANGRAYWICDDTRSPFQCDTAVPDSSSGVVRYYARAVDDVGQSADSNWVSITLLH